MSRYEDAADGSLSPQKGSDGQAPPVSASVEQLESVSDGTSPQIDGSTLHSSPLSRPADGLPKARKSLDLANETDGTNEQSPLLPPRTGEETESLPQMENIFSPSESENDWVFDGRSQSRPETKSSWYLFLLTLAMSGLQIAWSVELSNGSPYLLGLGISKSLLALVWIAGPLSGTLVQPYVGIKSDRCRSRFGKRRPFMIGGAIATIISLMALAWTPELIGGALNLFGAEKDSQGVATTIIVFAVLMIYVLDFSINVIQAGIRAFIVDNAPMHQQDSANAWASRLSGVGNIVGYLFGYVDLPKYLPFLGDTQFKVLCVIASVALGCTLAVSCGAVGERDPRDDGKPGKQDEGVLAFFKGLWHSIRRLPPQISKVCQVQFFAWIGWFPFLFYITTYVGEIYAEPYFRENPHMTDQEIDEVWQHATRTGTFALFMFAITSFVASVVLPFVIASTHNPPEPPLRTPMTPGAAGHSTPAAHTATPTGISRSGSGYFAYSPNTHPSNSPISSFTNKTSTTATNHPSGLPSLEIPALTLRRAWLLSHLLFALLMALTFLTHSTASATALVAAIGIPWALTNWAPFALIAAEIARRDAIRRGHLAPPPTRDCALLAHGEDPAAGADQAGVVLGIHNVAIAAPQVVATLVSSVIFREMQRPRGSAGDDSVAWVLRFGGLAAAMAAWLTRRVGKERG